MTRARTELDRGRDLAYYSSSGYSASYGKPRRSLRRLACSCWSRRPSRSATPAGVARGRATRIGVSAADAETEGLLAIGERVIFRHPLVRSAVYRSASPHARRAVHLALAEVTNQEVDPDRRAWRLAAAAPGPDEKVALELEQSAGRAQARGGLAATAAFLQGSVALTQDPARRADRAQASLQAGAFDEARTAGRSGGRDAERTPARPGGPAARTDRVCHQRRE
jgi:hypothetical protein